MGLSNTDEYRFGGEEEETAIYLTMECEANKSFGLTSLMQIQILYFIIPLKLVESRKKSC